MQHTNSELRWGRPEFSCDVVATNNIVREIDPSACQEDHRHIGTKVRVAQRRSAIACGGRHHLPACLSLVSWVGIDISKSYGDTHRYTNSKLHYVLVFARILYIPWRRETPITWIQKSIERSSHARAQHRNHKKDERTFGFFAISPHLHHCISAASRHKKCSVAPTNNTHKFALLST